MQMLGPRHDFHKKKSGVSKANSSLLKLLSLARTLNFRAIRFALLTDAGRKAGLVESSHGSLVHPLLEHAGDSGRPKTSSSDP